jgi:D-mannonate dehydratase
MKNNEYQCAICGGIFRKGRTDEEAEKEAENIWGVKNASTSNGMVVICDGCFNTRTPEEIKNMGEEFQKKIRGTYFPQIPDSGKKKG